ncbi:c-type cytochrome [Pseudoxanthomonas mexicana]|uniref:c-type cytochrome n=1 Tax=Pseudoxanthomonas mexicana TaxID=128785 RepID=UPI0007832F4E|nr:c-type cytochrome [Pseudoxanthomonas mexicana]
MTHRLVVRTALLLLIGGLTRVTAAQAPPAAPSPASRPPAVLTDEAARRAGDNYQRYCALCHGRDREGHVNDHAPSLRSRSLLESEFPVLGEAIGYGRQGTPMGGYLDEVGGPMTRQEIGDMLRWLRKTAAVEAIDMGNHSLDRTIGDATRGAAVYAQQCATCHGTKGEGGTGTALGNAAMLALTPDRFLRHAIVNGRQGTPMPAFGGVLSKTQIDDVTAFLRSRSTGSAAGKRTLRTPPALADAVINATGRAPEFGELKEGRYLSAAALDRELKAKRRMVLLDTRVTSMWQMAHIEGAVPIPYYSRDVTLAALPRDGTWIVAYCECPRAAADSVVKRLREDGGFKNTAVLYEGIQGWVSLGYPVVAGDATKPAATPSKP